MRPIKFRAWDIQKNRWFSLTYPDPSPLSGIFINNFGELHAYGEGSAFLMALKKDVYKIDMATSLLDKNGKEIFEGDIVAIDGRPYEVRFGLGEYDSGAYSFLGFYLFCHKGNEQEENTWWVEEFQIKRREVIGNIWDNPELVKN